MDATPTAFRSARGNPFAFLAAVSWGGCAIFCGAVDGQWESHPHVGLGGFLVMHRFGSLSFFFAAWDTALFRITGHQVPKEGAIGPPRTDRAERVWSKRDRRPDPAPAQVASDGAFFLRLGQTRFFCVLDDGPKCVGSARASRASEMSVMQT